MIITTLLAQIPTPVKGGLLGCPEGDNSCGPFGDWIAVNQVAADPAGDLEKIISTVIGVITIIAGLWFLFNLFIGAVGIITGAGNEDAIKTNTKKISQSLIGLVIVIAAYAVVGLIGSILGFTILDLSALIGQVSF